MKQLYFSIFTGVLLFATIGNAQCTPPAITGTTVPATPICAGTSATFTATSDTGTLVWFNAATGGTQVGTGGTYNSPALSATTSYWVEAQGELVIGTPQSGGGKTTHGNSGTTISSASNPWGLVFNVTQPFILNSVEVYLTSGTPGDIVVQLKDSNFTIIATTTVACPAGGTNSNPVTFTVPLNFDIPVGTGYRLVADSGPAMIRDFSSGVTFPYPIGTVGSITQGTINDSNTSNSGLYYLFYNWNFTPYTPCASPRQQVTANVNVTPQPAANAHTFCGAATVAELEATGTDLKWYAGSTGGTQLADNTALTSTTYYVSQTLDGCESTRKSVPVTITPLPAAPVIPSQSFCNSATVGELGSLGANLSWYANETDVTPLSGTAALSTNTYYVSQTVNSCESTRTPVSVTINTLPAAPMADPQTFCGAATVAQLTADGNNLKWYTTETAVNNLSDDTPIFNGTYYVSQSTGSCESTRTAFSVTVNELPDAPLANAHTFCGAATVAQLTADGDNLQWYATETATDALTDVTTLANGTYYVSQNNGNCESPRTEVSVTINEVPDAPMAEAHIFCNSGTAGQLEAEGDNLLWYDSETADTAMDDEDLLITGTYYVSQTVNGCESARTPASVTINLVFEPVAEDEQNFTEGQTLADLEVLGTGLVWFDADGNELDPSTPLVDGTTYFVGQVIDGCAGAVTPVTVHQMLSVGENSLPGLSFYPNPVTDKLMLIYSSPITDVTVYNLMGQKFIGTKVNATDAIVDFSAFSAGTYIVKVTSGDATGTFRVIKR